MKNVLEDLKKAYGSAPEGIEITNAVYYKLEKKLSVELLNASEDFKDFACDFFCKKFPHTSVVVEVAINEEDNNSSFDKLQRQKEEEWVLEAKKRLEENSEKQEKVQKKQKTFKKITNPPLPISVLYDEEKRDEVLVIRGEIYGLDTRETASSILISFFITDNENSFSVKKWVKPDEFETLSEMFYEGNVLMIEGKIEYDSYLKSDIFRPYRINESEMPKRIDTSPKKRVELTLHTQMSAMDGISTITDYISRAKDWGMEAIAVADSFGVQAFPDAAIAAKDAGIKMIYGMEANVFDDEAPVIWNLKGELPDTYTVFDIETSGLTPYDSEIIEIGAVKVKDGVLADSFSRLIKPENKISQFTTNLTGITNALLEDKPPIEEVLPDFLDFIKGTVLVAHNAKFDTGFIRHFALKQGFKFDYPILDTMPLARKLYPDFARHTLDFIAKRLDVELKNHHRAVDDADATAKIFIKMLETLGDTPFNFEIDPKLCKNRAYHVTILVKNQIGLKNLYELVSLSNLDYYLRTPRIPKSLLSARREGLLIGSGDFEGEIFEELRSCQSEEDILNAAKFYDFLEVQPIEVMREAAGKENSISADSLSFIRKEIVRIGENLEKIVAATGSVRYLESYQNIYRRIIDFNNKPRPRFSVYPDLHFRTTDEMLSDFKDFGEEKAFELVVSNTVKIAEMIEEVSPVPNGTFPPKVEGSEEEIKNAAWKTACEWYGEDLPEIVRERIDRELKAIIDNGYAIMYLIARRLVVKANEDGYLVGSRGSVGSSFVATMVGITEVNPLSPHYRCEKCRHSDFESGKDYDSGVDMPDKICPVCGAPLIKDGHNIPFEVFMGFHGDKEPDIDLNFAGEYQPVAHKLTEELFGTGNVFRAGTISTVAEKTALGYVINYYEKYLKEVVSYPEKIRLAKGITGVKRTTGQHPGGIMVVPDYKDIYDFTPIQHPADDQSTDIITTHFDYHKIEGRILKLDILGHDVPSMIRQLEDLTGIDPLSIPLDDKETMKLFTSVEPLGLSEEDLGISSGTLGIPEFGTKFVLGVLKETTPQTFADLVRISGLSHGTDVWVGNARDLISANIIPFNKVIATREDIMLGLIKYGLSNKTSFDVMEKVRKGKWKKVSEEIKEDMKAHNVPNWYIDSLAKIQYMFPKAHAVAYVMMSFRMAYYKINYPKEFYATIFTTKIREFKSDYVDMTLEELNEAKEEILSQGNKITAKDQGTVVVFDLIIEMLKRGIFFKKISLYESLSEKFSVTEDGFLLPPLIAVDGLGDSVAREIVIQRKEPFMSIEDLKVRTGVNQSVVKKLDSIGVLEGMSQTDQLDMFSMM